jgi:hypothetical protein
MQADPYQHGPFSVLKPTERRKNCVKLGTAKRSLLSTLYGRPWQRNGWSGV